VLKRALLPLLLTCGLGCGGDLVIGNARVDAGSAYDAANPEFDAGFEAGYGELDAGLGDRDAAPTDASTTGDASSDALLAASHALGPRIRWVAKESVGMFPGAGVNLQLAFAPSISTPDGAFFGYCPGGCPFLEFLTDAGIASSRPPGGTATLDRFVGRYTLYYINPSGTVFGVLYTEDGFSLNLRFEWGTRPPNQSLEEIQLAFTIGNLPLVPQRTGSP
jgi:hypothetical protein